MEEVWGMWGMEEVGGGGRWKRYGVCGDGGGMW